MATATFNTNIETPAPAKVNSYDLDRVITKDGFGDYLIFNYSLYKPYLGVSLVGNILSINENAYGKISVTVSAGDKFTPIQANAETKLYGFYATRLDILNNESTMIVLETALASAKADWPSLVGIGDKAAVDGGGIGPGIDVNPGVRS